MHPFHIESLTPAWSQLSADHIVADVRAALETAKANIQAICEIPLPQLTYENTFGALESADDLLSNAWGLIMHLDAVNDHPEQREAITTVLPEVSAFYASLPLNTDLWFVLKAFAESPVTKTLGEAQKRFVDETVKDFKRSGADLEPDEKAKVAKIQSELSELTKKFSENVLDSTNAWELIVDDKSELTGLPESAQEGACEDALAKAHGSESQPKWRFTLQFPSMYPVMQFADNDALRRKVWEGNGKVGNSGDYQNESLIWKILEKRQQLASILGKDNFSDHVLENRMAKDGQTALNFVVGLHNRIKDAFDQEAADLEQYKADKTGQPVERLEPWESAYWMEKRRKELFDFDEEEIRPYFPVEQVMRGMFNLCEQLFGLKIEEKASACIMEGGQLPANHVEVWHPDCKFYELHDADSGAHLGSFFADWHPRESKRGGAWMNPIHTGRSHEQGRTPHWGVIVGNMTKPVGTKPALLTHREVETIFHEFGHLLHHLLSDVEVRALSGTNVPWDFVELPSQIMENFCWDRASLDLFARHYESGDPIPEDLFQKMLAARNYLSATNFMRQLAFAKLDLDLHQQPSRFIGRPISEVDDEILEGYRTEMKTKSPSMSLRFTHLFASPVGYASGYYSYKWAEVLDADAFTRFQKEGVTNERTGRDFRKNILSKGNSAQADQLFRDFMGRDPDETALLVRAGLA